MERLAVSGRLTGPGSPHLAPAGNLDGAAPTQPFLLGPSLLGFSIFLVVALESIEKTTSGEGGNEMHIFVGKFLKRALRVCV